MKSPDDRLFPLFPFAGGPGFSEPRTLSWDPFPTTQMAEQRQEEKSSFKKYDSKNDCTNTNTKTKPGIQE